MHEWESLGPVIKIRKTPLYHMVRVAKIKLTAVLG